MNDQEIAEFVKSRDEAFISFVMDDNLDKFYEHCRKYNIELPKINDVVKAGICKAVQECTNIPNDVKLVAFMKCLILGFDPYINWGKDE